MFKIYSSSAGSGKTYTLTLEYLKLALGDRREVSRPFEPKQYKHILAVTFTNAAANEMKERILKELRLLSGQEPNTMREVLSRELNLEPDAIRSRARAAFHAILHDYSGFAVQTIDSFVQRVVTAFTDELNLPYSFEVEMDTDALLQTAIDRLLEKVGMEDHQHLSDALQAFYLEKAADGKSWYGLADSLVDFSKGQLGDRNFDMVERLHDLSPADFKLMRAKILESLQRVEQEIQRKAQEGYTLITRSGLTENAFYQGRSGVAVYLRKRASEGGFPEDPNSYVRKALEEDVWYTAGKKRLPDHDLIDSIKVELRTFIDEIEQLRTDNRERYLSLKAVEQHLQKVALLKHVKQECDEVLREQNRLHISEFNRLIMKVVTHEPVPFLYERLGEKFHHILIDEFQDTSRLQFVNLLPLIDNNLAYQRFNLAVGDSKQAIYRFRGGDMDQIVALHRRNLDALLAANLGNDLTTERLLGLQSSLAPDRLGTNWRSAESIVEFNNSFFRFLSTLFSETAYEQVVQVFDEAFEQQVPDHKTGSRGRVQLDFIEKPDARKAAEAESEGPDYEQQMAERTLLYIEQALADGYQYGDMAILCRVKRNARRLADFLETRGIPLTSEDSLTLQSSVRVRFLVALLQLIHQPADKIARYELLFIHQQFRQNDASASDLPLFVEEVAGVDQIDALFGYLARIEKGVLNYGALLQLTVYELVEKLADYFDLFDQERESAYLFRFLDEVLTFSSRHSSHLADFLVYWQTAREKVSVNSPRDSNAVTIQTIHKSKGLEYPIVIIPFADWASKPRNGDTMWADLTPLAELDELAGSNGDSARREARRLMATSITIEQSLADTPLAAQYHDELYRTFVECMNLLYVAFTRPTDRLYILAAKRDYAAGKDGKPKNTDGIDFWLYTYLNDLRGDCRWCDDQLSYALQDYLTRPTHSVRSESGTAPTLSVAFSAQPEKNPLQLRRAAERASEAEDLEKSRALGTKVCAALSQIQSVDDVGKTLRKMVMEGTLRQPEQLAVENALLQVVNHPELRYFFMPATKTAIKRNILLRNGKRTGPSRVIYLIDKIVLLHFLCGPPLDQHRTQADSVANLYRDMGHPMVASVLVYVEEPTVVWV